MRFIPGAGRRTGQLVLSAYGSAWSSRSSPAWRSSAGWMSGRLGSPSCGTTRVRRQFVLATAAWCIQVLAGQRIHRLASGDLGARQQLVYATFKLGLLIALANVMPDYGVFASWTLGLVVLVPMADLIFTRLDPPRPCDQQPNRAPRADAGDPLRSGDYLGAMAWLAATTLLPILVTHHVGLAQTAYFYLAWAIAFALHDVGDNMGYSLVVEGANDPTSLRASSRHVLIHTTRIVLVLAIIMWSRRRTCSWSSDRPTPLKRQPCSSCWRSPPSRTRSTHCTSALRGSSAGPARWWPFSARSASWCWA